METNSKKTTRTNTKTTTKPSSGAKTKASAKTSKKPSAKVATKATTKTTNTKTNTKSTAKPSTRTKTVAKTSTKPSIKATPKVTVKTSTKKEIESKPIPKELQTDDNNKTSLNAVGLSVAILLLIIGICIGAVITQICLSGGFKQLSNVGNEDFDKKTTVCDTCVSQVVLDDEILKGKSSKSKILLGDKIRTLRINAGASNEVYVDGKLIYKATDKPIVISGVYVISNDIIALTLSGSDIRGHKYMFFDKNLNTIEVNMILDQKYSEAMEQASEKGSFVVDGNIIRITATRLYDGPTLAVRYFSSVIFEEMCDKDAQIIPKMLEKYKGELLSGVYEKEYLGNNRFSSWKLVKTISTVDENFCK